MFSLVFFFGLLLLGLCFYYLSVWDVGWWLNGDLRYWFSPFECGFMSFVSVENYFSSSLFLLLVFFVIFDLEVLLLLNVPLEGLLYKSFFSYLFFVCCLVLGFVVEVEEGYVKWES